MYVRECFQISEFQLADNFGRRMSIFPIQTICLLSYLLYFQQGDYFREASVQRNKAMRFWTKLEMLFFPPCFIWYLYHTKKKMSAVKWWQEIERIFYSQNFSFVQICWDLLEFLLLVGFCDSGLRTSWSTAGCSLFQTLRLWRRANENERGPEVAAYPSQVSLLFSHHSVCFIASRLLP